MGPRRSSRRSRGERRSGVAGERSGGPFKSRTGEAPGDVMRKYGKIATMTKTAAFNALGYDVGSARGIWSKDSSDGKRVLVTLWDSQIREEPNCLSVDLDTEHPAGLASLQLSPQRKARHMKRAQRLTKVMHGRASLDVTVIFGSGDRVDYAMPWRCDEQFGREWRIISVRPDDGFYRVEARLSGE